MSSGNSTGQIIGTIVGAVIAYFLPGSYVVVGAAIGGAVGGAIDPPKGPKIAGPRLSDLGQQTATYGAVIPRIYGAAAVAGNVFWIENNALKEVASTEEQGGKGGGGGAEVTSYKYYATFALGLCEGPIEGIRRIWVSGRLIYDAGATDFDTVYATAQIASGITLYKGTETQTANERMQATLGAANTPAYRGLAYLVFEDFDLTDYGNTLIGAQFKVEVIKGGTYSSAIVRETTQAVAGSYGRLGPVAVRGRSPTTRWVSGTYLSDFKYHVVNDDGSVSAVPCYPGSVSSLQVTFKDCALDQFAFAASANNPAGSAGGAYFPWGNVSMPRAWEDAISICEVGGACLVLGYGAPFGSQDTGAVVYAASGSGLGTVTAIPYNVNGIKALRHAGLYDTFVLFFPTGRMLRYVSGVWTDVTVANGAGTGNFFDAYIENGLIYRFWGGGAAVAGARSYGYDVIDFSTLIMVASGTAKFSVVGSVEWPYLAYIKPPMMVKTGQCDPGLSSPYLVQGGYEAVSTMRAIAASTVPLSSIVSTECQLSSVIAAGDLDVTALTDPVNGYRVSQVAALRSNIEPLQGAWPFDIIQSGYKVKFKKRGASSSVASIIETQLAARAGSGKGDARLTQSREMDTQLPVRVSINFLDIGREYDPNEQYCERLGTGSVNIRQVEMPIVMSATEAVQKAEVLLYMYWLERYEFAFRLPPSFNALEPGDVVTVTADGASYQLRLTSVHWQSDGVIDCTARLNDNTTYTSTAVADTGLQYQSTITLRGATAWEMLDIPTIADAQDAPGFIAAIGRYKSGWPGGGVYKSTDGQSWNLLESTNLPVVIGFAKTAIAAPLNFGLIDKASRLQVVVPAASLASVTEGQMLNGANHFAYGKDSRWEIIAAQNCTLQGDGSYILTDFLRGRFGTEWAAGLHYEGDRIIQLSSSLLKFVAASANAIGVPIQTKGITIGDDLNSATAADFTYRGVNLECLSPVYLNGTRAASGDWSLEWIRRGRTGGEWRDSVDVPLGEASEAYEIEIYSSSAYTTLKRTLSSPAPAVSYTSAQQVADFGSNQATLYVKVYQLSAIVGRGTPLTTSITR